MNNPSQNVALNSAIDPYVYHTLLSIQGGAIVAQTTQGSVRGILKTVMPDHIVVEVSGTPFFVRTQQIVWVHPDRR
ncbi:YuzF family protein [Halobacillus litoralis]|uniref:YuzF family protein n=1 Tax=Halobacillus litoralis TaxID=45668 RepID=UPI001CD2900E|nr:YuzF family protein [Halobacillus litoralis]MCA0971881.1 YuzF family protein [Halobacillus litoralis]